MTPDSTPLLALDAVCFGFADRPDFLGPVTMRVMPGECWAVVGPNGAGKSTLLRIMAGLLSPASGVTLLGDARLASFSARQRARRLAFMPQHPPVDAVLTVRETVLLGRHPHRSLGLFESAEDYDLADEAMTRTDTLSLADRVLGTLSGGEAQRVHLAAALVQQPQVLLLDEPTASLDLAHQLTLLDLLRDLARRDGLGVVMVTHDLNLAARLASQVILLDDGRVAACGSVRDVLTPDVLAPVYGVRMADVLAADDSSGERPLHWLVPMELLSGNKS